MRIAMIGTGYVGLVSGACFSEFGVDVVCVDKDAGKIARLKKGEIPIYEPGLEDLVRNNAEAGRLTFTTDLQSAVAGCDAVFIAVGTPSRRGDGHADLSYVYAAAREIARAVKGFTVVVDKSTVPVGTGDEAERNAEQDRDAHRAHRQFDGRRHACEDEGYRRHVLGERAAKVSAQGVAHEVPVLEPQRLV